MLQSFLFKIKDHRRRQGRRYHLGHLLLFAILALLSGATSYRKVHAFIQARYKTLDEVLGLNWKKLPAYTTIRGIIQGTSPAEIEACFREYSAHLAESESQKRVSVQLGSAAAVRRFARTNSSETRLRGLVYSRRRPTWLV